MLDIQAAPARGTPFPPIEFLRIELSPLADGRVHVALTATTVDEEFPELLDTEIARDQVASIDDVVALIRAHVRIGANLRKEH
jgi:hypothetical protein